jgi:hypothetical protein
MVVPHAGRFRARLRAGSDADAIASSIRRAAAEGGVHLAAAEQVPSDLEDIVVAMLEQRELT